MATGTASAADKLALGVGGYMQQWFGYASRGDMGSEGGMAAQSDSEVHFKGSLESDSGMKFSVHMELEGDRGSNAIDESFARVSGEFGQIEIGARDHVMVRMHSGISDVGIGLTSGDTQKWVPGTYLETAGHAIGNARKLNYISPRVSGLQIGLSYAPDDTAQDANTGGPDGNAESGVGVGLNFQQEVGDMAITFSLGHRSADSAGSEVDYMSAAAAALDGTEMRLSQAQHAAHKAAWEKLEYLDQNVDENETEEIADAAAAANILIDGIAGRKAIMDATSSMMAGEEKTYTNFGVGVGFGAFKFNVAYAVNDGGAFKAMPMPVGMTSGEMTAEVARINTASGGTTASAVGKDGNTAASDTVDAVYVIDTAHMFDHDNDPETDKVAEAAASGTDPTAVDYTAAVNDPRNETWMASKVVKDMSKDFDVWGVSVSYTDGPVALSLGHMVHATDAGGERTATMLSSSYTMAPGVAWKTSVFGVEDTTSNKNVTGGVNEGTGFVTGIALSF